MKLARPGCATSVVVDLAVGDARRERMGCRNLAFLFVKRRWKEMGCESIAAAWCQLILRALEPRNSASPQRVENERSLFCWDAGSPPLGVG